MYKPLPKKLTIRNSEIEGLGLFSEIKISKNSFIGVSHIKNDLFSNNYIRTPLGDFYNHSNSPNLIKLGSDTLPEFEFGKILDPNLILSEHKKSENKSKYLFLVSLEDIYLGQELVAKYTFYQF
jgi:hypothetical protein|tara:strand:- start:326 stop:697 length:372 start_codon:yes stop_codon:yes gene_type:complete